MTAQRGNGVRALVVVNEAVVGSELRDSLVDHLGAGGGDVFVVAPALVDSGLKHTLGDVDDAIAPAEQRLQETLAELRKAGIEARGEVGDSDPNVAMEDALRVFPADEIIVSTHPPRRSHWLEQGVVERAREQVDLPVTHVVVDLEVERATNV